MKKVVFIDRDGVINVDPIGDYVKTWDDFRFEKGALEALKRILDSGLEIILISNQAGIGDGVYPEASLWDIHKKMLAEFKKKGILIRSSHFCLHGKQAGCGCRKPEIGLFKEAVKDLAYDPQKTYFVGDKATDVEAGKRFGIKTIFVRTGHGRLDEKKLTGKLKPDHIANNLSDAVEFLLP
ncbi:MAG: HAD family hydrolase [Candidatus Omnitrophica bacterium]|nr:HAD family hydrolase [Candidatus Omnitrophota bacterium]